MNTISNNTTVRLYHNIKHTMITCILFNNSYIVVVVVVDLIYIYQLQHGPIVKEQPCILPVGGSLNRIDLFDKVT